MEINLHGLSAGWRPSNTEYLVTACRDLEETENSQYTRVLELEYIQVLETCAERIESSNLSSGIRGVIMDLLDKLLLTRFS